MKYAVIKCINGHYFIHTEGHKDLQSAIVSFHDVCKTLWNAADVISAAVMIVDENIILVDKYQEFISHPEEAEEPTND